ncbi:MAG: 2-oxoacid:acceptor oxidoreductase family protein, partial [Candidatus Adiutrix sp.]|nr:2-oxoacid:acceptor oxidoreductase family protein [Candidatus Adiutrix sp.]
MRDSLTIVIGGEAGQGLATVGELLARILTRAGHNFLTFQGYHSRIRGGHNTFAL